uniref:G-protein coupled receptors family 1 profile domain-containing protein n=1 Tax=Panagrolaimus sp. ES5 TaxID=591445 RepID=A0AC34FPR4_9BILA
MYSSLSPEWHFIENDSAICKITAYLQVVVLTATIYTFAWVSVDRYSAFMKPSRYESDHTLIRCKCWIAFSWSTAVLIACPIIITKMEVIYHPEFELCVLNWSSAVAYSITLAVLVIGPSLCTIIFTASSVFRALQKPEELEDTQKSIIENDRNFVVSVFVMICFALSWLPIIITQFLPSTLLSSADVGTMKFAFMWLGIGAPSSKILIFIFINPEFRRTFCALCTGMTAVSSSANAESTSYSSLDFIDCCIPEQRSCLSSMCCCLFCGCCICFRKVCCKTRTTTTTITTSTLIPTSTTYYNQNNNSNNRRIINSSNSFFDERVTGPMLLPTATTTDPNNFINSRYIPEYGSFSRFASTYSTEGYT